MKTFKGRAIYNPSGKAGEYSYWACNFYVGCSNGCEYCYCKKGILAGTMGGDRAVLKKCFFNSDDAINTFNKEVYKNSDELKHHGLFFSFTTDPMLPETIALTKSAIMNCIPLEIPVKILTKRTDWINDFLRSIYLKKFYPVDTCNKFMSIGFTLTGHDELEPGASSNYDRMIAMKKLHDAGFKTWASIEPIIDLQSSLEMILDTRDFCNLYKIGLKSGTHYSKHYLREFIIAVCRNVEFHGAKVYFKDSLLKQAAIRRQDLPAHCVGRDYKLHDNVLSAAKLAE